MKRTIEPQELKELLKDNEDVVLIDVRRRSDYEADKAMIPERSGGTRRKRNTGAGTSQKIKML